MPIDVTAFARMVAILAEEIRRSAGIIAPSARSDSIELQHKWFIGEALGEGGFGGVFAVRDEAGRPAPRC